ncbi:MAG: hypothetical protein U9Q22_07290, partial [Candidatus Altiarchaeota archaeon]|nr:hypothetical protein [Candidatus Altiarchaeota archaeon]
LAYKYAEKAKTLKSDEINKQIAVYTNSETSVPDAEHKIFNKLNRDVKLQILENTRASKLKDNALMKEFRSKHLELFEDSNKIKTARYKALSEEVVNRAYSDQGLRGELVKVLEGSIIRAKEPEEFVRRFEILTKEDSDVSKVDEMGVAVIETSRLLIRLGESPYKVPGLKECLVDVLKNKGGAEEAKSVRAYLDSLSEIEFNYFVWNTGEMGEVFNSVFVRDSVKQLAEKFKGVEAKKDDITIEWASNKEGEPEARVKVNDIKRLDEGARALMETELTKLVNWLVGEDRLDPNNKPEVEKFRQGTIKGINKIFESLTKQRFLPNFGTLKGKTVSYQPLQAKIVAKLSGENVMVIAPTIQDHLRIWNEGFMRRSKKDGEESEDPAQVSGLKEHIDKKNGIRLVRVDSISDFRDVKKLNEFLLKDDMPAIFLTSLETYKMLEMHSVRYGGLYREARINLKDRISWVIGEETGEFPSQPQLIMGMDGNILGSEAGPWEEPGINVSKFIKTLYEEYKQTFYEEYKAQEKGKVSTEKFIEYLEKGKISTEGFIKYLEKKELIHIEDNRIYPDKPLVDKYVESQGDRNVDFKKFNNDIEFRKEKALLNTFIMEMRYLRGKDFTFDVAQDRPVIIHNDAVRKDMYRSQPDMA